MSKFITSILGTILCLGMVWFSAQATIIAFQRGTIFATIWGLPRGPILSIIPIGSFLLLVQFIIQSLFHLDQWKTMGRGNSKT
jgi:TRAP-type C4-dicarboxylate transport system permease small subunit